MQLGFSRRKLSPLAKRPSHRHSLKRRRLFFDCLEDRQLLSANALTAATSAPLEVSPSTVTFNVATPVPQAVAMDNAGNAAAVWMSPDANGDGGVTMNYAYYANGSLGSPGSTPTFEGTVATGVPAASSGQWIGWAPVLKVAMAPTSGDFVVLWETSANTSSPGKYSTTFTTFAQVFDPASADPTAGATGKIVVGAGSKASNMATSVAMNDSGFDVLYNAGTAGSLDISATVQRYNVAGQAQGSPITITPHNTGYQSSTTGSISMDDNDDFVVVWDAETGAWANPGNYFYIDAQRYDSATQTLGSVIQVNPNDAQYPNIQNESSVSMDPVTGDFVVAWADSVPSGFGGNGNYDLLARQFSANGAPMAASAIPIATATWNTATYLNAPYASFPEPSGGLSGAASVAAVRGGSGAFDVTWTNNYMTLTPTGLTTGSGWRGVAHSDIYAKTYNALGAQTQWLAVTSDGTSSAPSAAVDATGDLLALWNDGGQIDGQLYKPNAQADGGLVVSAPASATAGQLITVTVTGPAGYSGTLNLASSAATVSTDSSNPSLQGLPATVTLTNGVGTFQVALETAGLQTLTATSADGSVTASATIDVAPAAAARFAISAPPSDEAGTPITFTVTALDAYGNVVTGYNGEIQVSTTDSSATGLPSGYVTLVDGVGTFTVTFFDTTAYQYILATDSTGSITGSSIAIYVYPPPTQPYGHGGKNH